MHFDDSPQSRAARVYLGASMTSHLLMRNQRNRDSVVLALQQSKQIEMLDSSSEDYSLDQIVAIDVNEESTQQPTIDESTNKTAYKKMKVPIGNFKNDEDPMGLTQETIDRCLQYKMDITSQFHNMDQKIKSWSKYKIQVQPLDQQRSPGPLDPNCVIPEDEFSPWTVNTAQHSKSRAASVAFANSARAASQVNNNDNFQTMSNQAAKKRQGLTNALLTSSRTPKGLQQLSQDWSRDKNRAFSNRLSLNPSSIQRMPAIASQRHSSMPKLAASAAMTTLEGKQLQDRLQAKMSSAQSLNRESLVTSQPRSDFQNLLHSQTEALRKRHRNSGSAQPLSNALSSLSLLADYDDIPHEQLRQLRLDKIMSIYLENYKKQSMTHSPPQLARGDLQGNKRQSSLRHSISSDLQSRQMKQSLNAAAASGIFLLPSFKPSRKRDKKTLVIDLDETLVHSQFKPTQDVDIVLTINISNIPNQVMNQKVFACKRPFCDQFLEAVAPHFEIVMFTASLARYAEPLFKRLDPKGKLIDTCLYREHCTQYKRDLYVKDLTRLGRSIEDIIIIDNSPNSYLFQPQNALPCVSWYDDKNDTELATFIPILEKLSRYKGDVRRILRKIRPKNNISGSKVDVIRANTTLDKYLSRQLAEETLKQEQETLENEQEIMPVIQEDYNLDARLLTQLRPAAQLIENSPQNNGNTGGDATCASQALYKALDANIKSFKSQASISSKPKESCYSSLLGQQIPGPQSRAVVNDNQIGASTSSSRPIVKLMSSNTAQPSSKKKHRYEREGELSATSNRALTGNFYRKIVQDLRLKEKLLREQIDKNKEHEYQRLLRLDAGVKQSGKAIQYDSSAVSREGSVQALRDGGDPQRSCRTTLQQMKANPQAQQYNRLLMSSPLSNDDLNQLGVPSVTLEQAIKGLNKDEDGAEFDANMAKMKYRYKLLDELRIQDSQGIAQQSSSAKILSERELTSEVDAYAKALGQKANQRNSEQLKAYHQRAAHLKQKSALPKFGTPNLLQSRTQAHSQKRDSIGTMAAIMASDQEVNLRDEAKLHEAITYHFDTKRQRSVAIQNSQHRQEMTSSQQVVNHLVPKLKLPCCVSDAFDGICLRTAEQKLKLQQVQQQVPTSISSLRQNKQNKNSLGGKNYHSQKALLPMNMTPGLKTELPKSILQTLTGTRSYAAAATPMNRLSSVLSPLGTIGQMTNFQMPNHPNQAAITDRKFERELEHMKQSRNSTSKLTQRQLQQLLPPASTFRSQDSAFQNNDYAKQIDPFQQTERTPYQQRSQHDNSSSHQATGQHHYIEGRLSRNGSQAGIVKSQNLDSETPYESRQRSELAVVENQQIITQEQQAAADLLVKHHILPFGPDEHQNNLQAPATQLRHRARLEQSLRKSQLNLRQSASNKKFNSNDTSCLCLGRQSQQTKVLKTSAMESVNRELISSENCTCIVAQSDIKDRETLTAQMNNYQRLLSEQSKRGAPLSQQQSINVTQTNTQVLTPLTSPPTSQNTFDMKRVVTLPISVEKMLVKEDEKAHETLAAKIEFNQQVRQRNAMQIQRSSTQSIGGGKFINKLSEHTNKGRQVHLLSSGAEDLENCLYQKMFTYPMEKQEIIQPNRHNSTTLDSNDNDSQHHIQHDHQYLKKQTLQHQMSGELEENRLQSVKNMLNQDLASLGVDYKHSSSPSQDSHLQEQENQIFKTKLNPPNRLQMAAAAQQTIQEASAANEQRQFFKKENKRSVILMNHQIVEFQGQKKVPQTLSKKQSTQSTGGKRQ